MYQVVELYGAFEPWWFLDDWKEDIVSSQSFETFDEALVAFRRQWTHLRVSHPYYKSQASLLAAFWDTKNQMWCDDCDETLQEYHSVALLKNWEELPESYHQKQFELRNDPIAPLSACKLKKIG